MSEEAFYVQHSPSVGPWLPASLVVLLPSCALLYAGLPDGTLEITCCDQSCVPTSAGVV